MIHAAKQIVFVRDGQQCLQRADLYVKREHLQLAKRQHDGKFAVVYKVKYWWQNKNNWTTWTVDNLCHAMTFCHWYVCI